MKSDEEGTQWKLLMPFLDSSPQFGAGFEMGILWERLKAGPLEFSDYVQLVNQDQALLMASKLNYKVIQCEEASPSWCWLELELRDAQ